MHIRVAISSQGPDFERFIGEAAAGQSMPPNTNGKFNPISYTYEITSNINMQGRILHSKSVSGASRWTMLECHVEGFAFAVIESTHL